MATDRSTSSKEASTAKSGWIDISYPLSRDMLYYPNDPITPHIDWVYHPDKRPGSQLTMAQLNINPHHGTHIDAPRHVFPDGKTIDEMPLDTIMGPARVIEIKTTESIEPAELETHNIQPGERILFKTKNSAYYKLDKYMNDFVYLSLDGAHFLKDKKISVVGADYFGIARGEHVEETHRVLLGNGIWIIEAIDLSAVKAGNYEIVCLPLRIAQGDGGPARAILRPL